MIDRRTFLATGSAAAALAVTAGCSRGNNADVHPPGLPLSAFDKHSTAEQVTSGISLAGKTVLITGATSGLGLESLRVMSLRGAHVIVTGRTLAKAQEACATVQGRTTPVAMELERWDTVAAAVQKLRALATPIDVLMCNAGIMALPKLEQVYGLEKQFVVNHLGHFILAHGLMEQVKAAPQGRVVAVSSSGYQWCPASGIEFDNLSGERDYDPNKMYGQSKLANQLMSLELARRLAGTAATSNAIHPGIINTNLGRHFAVWKRAAGSLIGWTFMKNVEEGAATQCYAATAPALVRVRGQYFEDCNPVVPKAGKHMDDAALAARLWDKSAELTRQFLV
jgi:NAD(P)-dependent dehydrogenase (short-subunit alcohol dehydrogenase family)